MLINEEISRRLRMVFLRPRFGGEGLGVRGSAKTGPRWEDSAFPVHLSPHLASCNVAEEPECSTLRKTTNLYLHDLEGARDACIIRVIVSEGEDDRPPPFREELGR